MRERAFFGGKPLDYQLDALFCKVRSFRLVTHDPSNFFPAASKACAVPPPTFSFILGMVSIMLLSFLSCFSVSFGSRNEI